MSTSCTHIVPVHTGDYPEDEAKAMEVLAWFQARSLVETDLSDCTLGKPGYRFTPEIGPLFIEAPDPRSQDLLTRGLELHHGGRTVFHPAEGAQLSFICPSCGHDQGWDALESIGDWYSRVEDCPRCPACGARYHINEYGTDAGGTDTPWAFSNLGITFWNDHGGAFQPGFLEAMRGLFGTDIRVVEVHI
ncbi:hypothetical protein CEK62_02210 [Alcanivorax sp. N3-2A]|nr:hypothetical protein CEK62_02210 [Alcanivorax sp. N3-2A]